MGKKGGGGGYDTSGMEKATREATALQKMIYEQTRSDVQPWYQAGVGSIGKLSDLLGISGGSVQGRQGVYDSLLPQYTTAGATSAVPEQWLGYGDAIYSTQQAARDSNMHSGGEIERPGHKPPTLFSPAQEAAADTVDYTGLNAAVEAQMASQGTPEGYGSLLETFDMSKFEEDPGAQYRRDQSQKALERSMSAQGVTLGGGGLGSINPQVAQALEQQSQDIASQEYSSAFDRYNIGQQNIFNRLMGVAGMGQGSTGQMGAAGQSYATNVGNLQTGLASTQMQAAQAKAAQESQGNSMFGQLLGTGTQMAMSYFSDKRLKENIELVGKEMGHNIYEFDYKDGSGRYRGVMADEVIDIEPSAVKEMSNGYLAVDYSKIGLEMERV